MLKTLTLDGWILSLGDWIMRESDGDGVAPSQAPSWWQVSYDHGETWHDRATWPDPNKEIGLAMARVRNVSGVRVDGEPEPLGTSANELARAAMARIGYLRGENPKKRDDALLEIAGYIRRLQWMAERTAGVDASSTSDREPS